MSQATSRSGRPTNGTSSTSRSNIRSVIAHARRNAVELAVVLDGAQLLDEALARHELEPASAQLLGERPRQDVRLEADRPERFSPSQPISERFVCTVSTPSTASRRLDVAEVGEEPHPVGLDEERGVRAVEARSGRGR